MTFVLLNIGLLALGVAALYFGAEWLVRGSARLAKAFGVPPIVIGLTVVSMGTSAPELVVCLIAALGGNPDMAVGNVLGSNLANIGLILGITAMIRSLNVAGRVIGREIPVMIAVTLLLFPLAWDGLLSRADGLILLVILGLYLLFIARFVGPETIDLDASLAEALDEEPSGVSSELVVPSIARDLGLILAGVTGLVIGGGAIVTSAESLAQAIGVPDMIVGLTVVAIGTSLPELATAVVAALRDEADIAVGNVIGSNVFNIGAILGITSVTAPIAVQPGVLRSEMLAVLALSVLVWPLALTSRRIHRIEGSVLLAAYAIAGFWLFRY
jgi:cation:H+ antiporter